jgi:rod shape-determining protein MreD
MSLIPVTDRIRNIIRLGVPLGFIALLLGLSLVGLDLPRIGLIHAPVFLIAIFYWAIYRPTLLPPWLIFACGGITDFIGNYPTGLNMLIFVLVRWLIADQRRFLMAQTFAMLWFGYGIVALCTAGLQWALISLLQWQWAPFWSATVTTGFGIMLFPLVYLILLGTHRFLPSGTRLDRFKNRVVS